MLEEYENRLTGERYPIYGDMRLPQIISIVKTLTRLWNDRRLSFARIGDGELTLMGGNAGCVYEKGGDGFAEMVARMLTERNARCMVGLSLPHYERERHEVGVPLLRAACICSGVGVVARNALSRHGTLPTGVRGV